MAAFIHSFQSEWLKQKNTLAWWIVIIGGFFTPAIIIIARISRADKLPGIYAADKFWFTNWRNAWESMAIFLLPVGVILATSLITQLEFKNNTWKQLHTTPLRLTTIFFSKFSVLLVMFAQFFFLFNVGVYLTVLVPYLVVSGVPYPSGEIPYTQFLKDDLNFFVASLPIIALQYLISLKYKNFLVPIGAGFLLWVVAIASLRWKYGFAIPYTYGMYNFLKDAGGDRAIITPVDINLMALGYFVLFLTAAYILYLTKREKG
jgi:hypothetical protein